MNVDDTVTKGVFKDEEAGILTYTLREKQPKEKEQIIIPKYNSIKDIYVESLKYITDKDYKNLTLKDPKNEN